MRVCVPILDLGSVRVDIRAFVSGKATIKGIWLTITEWEELSKLFKLIQRSLNEAKYEKMAATGTI